MTSPEPFDPLPPRAAQLLADVRAPPRLVAHLTLVHHVARALVDAVWAKWPAAAFDEEAVLFGAATHDIGKARHRAELDGPGAEHEAAGVQMLLERGVDERLARFAASHARWSAAAPLEDLLVSLADKIWKGKRVDELEDLVVARLAAHAGQDRWTAFAALDDVLTGIGADADARIAWQNTHPAR